MAAKTHKLRFDSWREPNSSDRNREALHCRRRERPGEYLWRIIWEDHDSHRRWCTERAQEERRRAEMARAEHVERIRPHTHQNRSGAQGGNSDNDETSANLQGQERGRGRPSDGQEDRAKNTDSVAAITAVLDKLMERLGDLEKNRGRDREGSPKRDSQRDLSDNGGDFTGGDNYADAMVTTMPATSEAKNEERHRVMKLSSAGSFATKEAMEVTTIAAANEAKVEAVLEKVMERLGELEKDRDRKQNRDGENDAAKRVSSHRSKSQRLDSLDEHRREDGDGEGTPSVTKGLRTETGEVYAPAMTATGAAAAAGTRAAMAEEALTKGGGAEAAAMKVKDREIRADQMGVGVVILGQGQAHIQQGKKWESDDMAFSPHIKGQAQIVTTIAVALTKGLCPNLMGPAQIDLAKAEAPLGLVSRWTGSNGLNSTIKRQLFWALTGKTCFLIFDILTTIVQINFSILFFRQWDPGGF